MLLNRKTRRGSGRMLTKPLIKIFVSIIVLIVIIFLVGKLDLPAPNKIIKQKIPNEKLKVIK